MENICLVECPRPEVRAETMWFRHPLLKETSECCFVIMDRACNDGQIKSWKKTWQAQTHAAPCRRISFNMGQFTSQKKRTQVFSGWLTNQKPTKGPFEVLDLTFYWGVHDITTILEYTSSLCVFNLKQCILHGVVNVSFEAVKPWTTHQVNQMPKFKYGWSSNGFQLSKGVLLGNLEILCILHENKTNGSSRVQFTIVYNVPV